MSETSPLLLTALASNLTAVWLSVLFKGIISCLKHVDENINPAVSVCIVRIHVILLFVFKARGYERERQENLSCSNASASQSLLLTSNINLLQIFFSFFLF